MTFSRGGPRIAGMRFAGMRFLTAGGTRRQMVGTALAGLILGLGSVTVGTSLVHASERDGIAGFFEMLFGGPRREAVAPPQVPPPKRARYSNLSAPRYDRPRHPVLHTPRPRVDLIRPDDRRRSGRPRRETGAVAAAGAGGRTVCVRLCDGYLFPLGTLRARADMPVHEAACAAACPNAATSVYTLAAGETELDRAVSPQGMPYRASALANIYRERRVASCSCQPADGAVHLPISEDMTLRKGDVVATEDSADVVSRTRTGAVQLTDFRRTRLSRGQTRQIEAKVGAIRRDEQARSFRRLMRAAEREGFVRVADSGGGFRIPERAAAVRTILPLQVAEPSPFLR